MVALSSEWFRKGAVCVFEKDLVIKINSSTNKTTLSFFYKQPVYKQLALGWQIAKQLLGLNPLLLSNIKNCR